MNSVLSEILFYNQVTFRYPLFHKNGIFSVSEHVARNLVMLRKSYCPESLVILIRCRSILVEIQGSNEEPEKNIVLRVS